MRNPPLLILSTFSHNKHFSHIKHTFFGLTKMCLLWVGTVLFLTPVIIDVLDLSNSNITQNSHSIGRFFFEVTIYFKDVKNMIRYFIVPKIRISRHFRTLQVRESRFPQVKVQNVTRCKFRISLCWERCAGSECTTNSRILA